MPSLPERIVASVTHDGKAIAGAFVEMQIPMRSKNDYALWFGPTDRNGCTIITQQMILDGAQKERCFFIMDYADIYTDVQGDLRVGVVDVPSIEGAVKAYRLYKDAFSYPPDFLPSLEKYKACLQQLGPGCLKATLSTEGKAIAEASMNINVVVGDVGVGGNNSIRAESQPKTGVDEAPKK